MMAPGRLHRWVGRWWNGEAGLAGRVADVVLAPAEWLFQGGVRVRNAAYDRGVLARVQASIPVISVGNLSVGGAGKTPFAAWLVGCLKAKGRAPAVVLRGYGSDEVLLHRELNPSVPVLADPCRAAAVERSAALGCDVAVLDDAFQHRQVNRDLDIVLVAAERPPLPLRLLPRGPFRETLRSLSRADLVVLTWKSSEGPPQRVLGGLDERCPRPVVGCHIAPTRLVPLHGTDSPPRPLESLLGERTLVVAALADPRPFRNNLAAAGARVEICSYPDHHDFTHAEAEELSRRAAGRTLVMTRKDAVKLRSLLLPELNAWILEQEVSIVWGADLLERTVDAVLERARP